MKRIFILLMLVLALCMSGCTDAPKATNLLKSQGYTQIQIEGYSFFGCSEEDYWRTEFNATSPNGQRVNGVVCEGILKGQTVRFD